MNNIGKVLVHCMMGLSRSATCVLAHLMIKEGLTAAEAVKQVRQNRFIKPNEGFLLQLVQLEKKLQNERLGLEIDVFYTDDLFEYVTILYSDNTMWLCTKKLPEVLLIRLKFRG